MQSFLSQVNCKIGGLEEGWKEEGWKSWKMDVEGWKGGRVEDGKRGRMEGWKDGRMEGWILYVLDGVLEFV